MVLSQMVKEVIRWDKGQEQTPISLERLYEGVTIDCGKKHLFRLEHDGLIAYPIRPEGFDYPLCMGCSNFLGMGRKCSSGKIASWDYLTCKQFLKKVR